MSVTSNKVVAMLLTSNDPALSKNRAAPSVYGGSSILSKVNFQDDAARFPSTVSVMLAVSPVTVCHDDGGSASSNGSSFQDICHHLPFFPDNGIPTAA